MKKMKKLLQNKLYPYFFASFPLLSLYDFNKDISQFSYLVSPWIISLLGTFSLLNISRLFFTSRYAINIFTSFFVLSFLSFGHFFEFSSDFLSDHFTFYSHKESSYQILYYSSILFWVFCLALLVLALVKKKRLRIINAFATYISVALICIPIINIGIYQLRIGANHAQELKQEQATNKTNPDIYYIILDGYGRKDVLREYYGLDNQQFIKQLTDRGFYVANRSLANYPQTYLSLSSSLNYDYLDSLIPNLNKDSDDRWILRSLIRNNSIYKYLAGKGYSFVTLPSIWSGTKNNLYSDYALGTQLSSNEFNQLVIKLTPIGASLGQKIRFDQQRKITNFSFAQLPKIASMHESTFVFMHFLIPHPPFIFDKNGQPINNRGKQMDFHGMHNLDDSENFKKYQTGYISQLQYVSKSILQSIDEILANSQTPPVIVLQSDHGPGSMLDWEDENKTNMHERMSILNAYHLPAKGKDMLYDSITPVNSFRVVFNALFDANLDLLEDRSYFARWSKPYDFIDVTDKLEE